MSSSGGQNTNNTDYNQIISTLPLLTKKKAQLDAHYAVCSSLVSIVSQRQLHKTFPLELALQNAQFINNEAAIPSQTTPQHVQDLVTMLQTANQHALNAVQNGIDISTMNAQTYTASLPPFDRLRLLAMLTLLGYPQNPTQIQLYTQLVEGLKRTCQDKRYTPTYHVSLQTLQNVLTYCKSLQQTLQMQQQPGGSGSNTIGVGHTGNQNTSAFGTFSKNFNLFGSAEKKLTPLAEVVLNTSNYSIVSTGPTNVSGPGGQANQPQSQHYAAMLLIDPLMVANFGQNGPNRGQNTTIPSQKSLQTLESFVFMVGGGNWTEYMTLCGDFSNFLYISSHEHGNDGSNSNELSQIGYDQQTQNKLREIVGITAPLGVVYGATEMITVRDLFDMIELLISQEQQRGGA
jgi:hypothetical protein